MKKIILLAFAILYVNAVFGQNTKQKVAVWVTSDNDGLKSVLACSSN